jgi:hypothetical protein
MLTPPIKSPSTSALIPRTGAKLLPYIAIQQTPAQDADFVFYTPDRR